MASYIIAEEPKQARDRILIQPGVVGSVGDVHLTPKLKHSFPDAKIRWETAFSGKNEMFLGSNISDGYIKGYDSHGGPARVNDIGWGGKRIPKISNGIHFQDIKPEDRIHEPLMGQVPQYPWKNQVATTIETKFKGNAFSKLPMGYGASPDDVVRGGTIPRVTDVVAEYTLPDSMPLVSPSPLSGGKSKLGFEMVLVRSHPTVGDGHFWGLVQQKGPWKETKQDRINANTSSKSIVVSGGGIGEGGTLHAGHGDWYSVTNPALDPSPAPLPKPSKYASRPIVIPAEITSFRKKPIPGILSATYEPVGRLQPALSQVEKETQTMTEQERPAVIEEELSTQDVEMAPVTPVKEESSFVFPPLAPITKLPKPKFKPRRAPKPTPIKVPEYSKVKKPKVSKHPGLPRPSIAGTKHELKTKSESLKKKIPKMIDDMEIKVRKPKPKLSITTTNLPPSKQSSTKVAGVRAEKGSKPKIQDMLPSPKTRAAKQRVNLI